MTPAVRNPTSKRPWLTPGAFSLCIRQHVDAMDIGGKLVLLMIRKD
jgi:hypothetical protein